MEKEYLVGNLEELGKIAAKFAGEIKNGDTVALIGQLGSGKTTFVKEVCKYFDIHNVTSPSFAIVNEYENQIKIYHLDFYRIKNVNELVNIGYYELIQDEEAIKFIEWADLYSNVLPCKRINVKFEFKENNIRKIIIEKNE